MTKISVVETIAAHEALEGELRYLDLANLLIDGDDDEVITARDSLAREMAAHPEKCLKEQFEELMSLYQDRCDDQRYDWSRTTEEVKMFVSRTPDCEHIEEQYVKIDNYGAGYRTGHTVTYAVKVIRAEQPSYVITHDGRSNVSVRTWDEAGETWREIVDDERDMVLGDFFYESLRATAMQLARSPEARQAADADAKEKLEYMLYGGKKVLAATE